MVGKLPTFNCKKITEQNFYCKSVFYKGWVKNIFKILGGELPQTYLRTPFKKRLSGWRQPQIKKIK